MEQTNILLVENDYFSRRGIASYLAAEGYQILEACAAEEALALANRHSLGAAIVNIVMRANGQQKQANVRQSVGLELVQQLKRRQPELGVVILSAHADRSVEVLEMLRTMRGLVYRVKGADKPDELQQAIQMAMAGNVWIDPRVELIQDGGSHTKMILDLCGLEERRLIKTALMRMEQLTPAEMVVLAHVGRARTTRGIAQALGVAPGTVESHVHRIYTKLFETAASGALRRSVLLAKVALVQQLQDLEASTELY